jgi:hypothetical protein
MEMLTRFLFGRNNFLSLVGIVFVVYAFLNVFGCVAHASVGDSYMRRSTPHEIAELIRKDLVTDPEGKALLSPEKCHQPTEKSCATAWDYLKSFQAHDQKANLTSVSQLPAFLDKLVEVQPKAGSQYKMDCLAPNGGDSFNPVIDCLVRFFGESEPAYADPDTNQIVMAFDCGNPVGQIREELIITAASNCLHIFPDIPKGTVRLHGEVTGARELVQSEKCPLPPDCNDHCDWRKINTDLGMPDAKPLEEIGIHDPKQGIMILLPRDAEHGFTLVLCVDVRGSDGAIHRSFYEALAFHGSSQDEIHMGTFKFPDGYVPE